jgi:hypothetical protein
MCHHWRRWKVIKKINKKISDTVGCCENHIETMVENAGEEAVFDRGFKKSNI